MRAPRISLIAAIGKNRELGKNNALIWRISPDLKRVKELTTGHPIIMGRKTYESIGRPLSNRTNIVISRTADQIEGCLVFDSVKKGVEAAKQIDSEEIFFFGGASLYAEALPIVTRLYLTAIDAEDAEADAFFPDFFHFKKEIAREEHPENNPPFAWITLER
jgi:dihydrofolate reductase